MNNVRVCLASAPELREDFLELAGFNADLNLKLSTYNLDMILEDKADEQILLGYGNLMKLYTKMGEAEKADEMKKKIAELRALSRGDKTE